MLDLSGGGVDPILGGGRRVRGRKDFPLAIASISSSRESSRHDGRAMNIEEEEIRLNNVHG